MALGGAEPALGEGQHLGVEVAVHGQSRQFVQPARSGKLRHEMIPAGDTISRWRPTGPMEPTPTASDAHLVALWRPLSISADDAGEVRVVRLGADVALDEAPSAIDEGPGRGDQRGFEPFGADVDGEHDVGRVRLRTSLVLGFGRHGADGR